MNLFVRAFVPAAFRAWALLMVVVLMLMLGGTLWMAQASEVRSVQLMVARLAHSLSTQTVEWMLSHDPGHWVPTVNPFRLLQVQPENYCGEKPSGEPLRRGCWYYLPERGQIIYRSRFAEYLGAGSGVRVWDLVLLPEGRHGRRGSVELQITGSAVEERGQGN